jgi:hypothetical protein
MKLANFICFFISFLGFSGFGMACVMSREVSTHDIATLIYLGIYSVVFNSNCNKNGF